jgi:hypothetical protein
MVKQQPQQEPLEDLRKWVKANREEILSTFQSDGWMLIMNQVVDEEMFSALDALFSLQVGDPQMALKYSYLKGQVDFIRSIYILEAMALAGDDEKKVTSREEWIANKIRSFYRRLLFWRG